MKKFFLVVVIAAAVGLAARPISSQQKEVAPAHQGHGVGEGMHQGPMMCPMMGGAGMMGTGGMGMMGGMMGRMMGGMSGGDPATMGQMMQMRGEMMMKMGEVMMKYGKQMHKGEAK